MEIGAKNDCHHWKGRTHCLRTYHFRSLPKHRSWGEIVYSVNRCNIDHTFRGYRPRGDVSSDVHQDNCIVFRDFLENTGLIDTVRVRVNSFDYRVFSEGLLVEESLSKSPFWRRSLVIWPPCIYWSPSRTASIGNNLPEIGVIHAIDNRCQWDTHPN